MMDNVLLVDFNDLFVLAVGLSMAYVVFKDKRQSSFFHILVNITESLKNWALDKKTRPQQQEEAVIARISYYMNSGLLQEKTKGALELVAQKANDVVSKVRELEKWISDKIAFHTKTDFLSVISYDCFLFGVFVLFAGVFQNKEHVCVDGLVEVMLFAMTVLLMHCLVFEHLVIDKRWKNFLRPSIVLHNVFLLMALGIGLSCKGTIPFPFSAEVLPVCCVVMCFGGFLAYLLMNILVNILLSVVVLYKIWCLKISSNAKMHETDMARYQVELDRVDGRLKKEKLGESMSFRVDDACTE